MIKERDVYNLEIAVCLIKDNWQLGYIKPNDKKGYENRFIFVFKVDEADEQKFNDRLNELKDKREKTSTKIKGIAIPINSYSTDKNIDMLILELTKVADAIVKDINRNFNNKIDEMIKAINNVNTPKLDNMKININSDEVGELGQKLMQQINKKSK